jgi:hypothetical protein
MWIKLAGIFCFTYGMMTANKLHHGVYRATLLLNEETGLELPFNFEVKYKGNKSQIIIQNAQEKITVEELEIKGDSVNFLIPNLKPN